MRPRIERASTVQTLNGRAGDINLAADKLADLGATWAKVEPGKPRQPVMLTRVHMRYDRTFKNDLLLKVTDEAAPVDGKFQVRHAYEGNLQCPEGARYATQLKDRQRRERANLIRLTGWSPKMVEEKARAR